MRRAVPLQLVAALLVLLQLDITLAQDQHRTIHVFVALCDNKSQGIVSVSESLGNGDSPTTNLYWGAAYGVRSYFEKNSDWFLLTRVANPKNAVLERCIFKHKTRDVFLVADAYRGRKIRRAIQDFLKSASGRGPQSASVTIGGAPSMLALGGSSDLVAYVGHNGLMDFKLDNYPKKRGETARGAIVLACYSKSYFYEPLQRAGASPVLWTTGLMAPEAYTLSSAIDGWIEKKGLNEIGERAALAYNRYQKCGLTAARKLLVTGW